MTPPAELVYNYSDEKIRKVKDRKNFSYKNWVIRVIPNLYPVFIPPKQNEEHSGGNSKIRRATGHHEVVIESPSHIEHIGTARISQIEFILKAYFDRISELSKKSYVEHVSIFKNYGFEAGASLSHPHSQLITTPFIPIILKQEINKSRKYWEKNNTCIFCDIIKKETLGPRFIVGNKNYLVFAPWASVNPFEFWIIPKNHHSNIIKISEVEMNDLAKIMRYCFGGLRVLLNGPPYNFGFHTIINDEIRDSYHWHLEVYPKLSKWAGFEKNNGIFINTVSPEDAAAELRDAIQAENNVL